jgi:hypothetical protein
VLFIHPIGIFQVSPVHNRHHALHIGDDSGKSGGSLNHERADRQGHARARHVRGHLDVGIALKVGQGRPADPKIRPRTVVASRPRRSGSLIRTRTVAATPWTRWASDIPAESWIRPRDVVSHFGTALFCVTCYGPHRMPRHAGP